MLPIAGQTARPNGLDFFWTLMGSRGCLRLKKIEFFFFHFFQIFFLQIKKNYTGNAGLFS